MKQLPREVAEQVFEWLGEADEILHWWEQNETYFVCVRGQDSLHFLCLFKIGGNWQLSQDAVKAI